MQILIPCWESSKKDLLLLFMAHRTNQFMKPHLLNLHFYPAFLHERLELIQEMFLWLFKRDFQHDYLKTILSEPSLSYRKTEAVPKLSVQSNSSEVKPAWDKSCFPWAPLGWPGRPPELCLTCVGALQERRLGCSRGQAGGGDREGLVQGCLTMLLETLGCHQGVGELLQGHVVDI